MLDAYQKNPKLGDPSTVEKEIKRQDDDLAKLLEEQRRFMGYLQEAESHLNAPINGAQTTPHGTPRG